MAPMPPLDRVRVVRAWAVHVFTMTGVVWACLAALALFEGQLALMWLWLGVALIVYGVDGTLARKAEVKTYAPGFDGAVLDVVDRDHPQQAAADQRRPNRAGQSFRVEDEIGGDNGNAGHGVILQTVVSGPSEAARRESDEYCV